jgi:thiol-disulfide isomerase/thioredoxin
MLFDPQHTLPALQQRLRDAPEALLAVCYCAAWCDTCTQYRPQLEALAARLPQHTFIWVDIEENPEWLGDEDVENFPTILVQRPDGGNMFFGTQLPHIGHLERLLEDMESSPGRQTPNGPPPLRRFS